MHAGNGYQPRQSRTVSLGGAFLINGAIIAGLIWSAPNILVKPTPPIFNITDYDPPAEPPPIAPEP
jgi:periplasmic protein TonB